MIELLNGMWFVPFVAGIMLLTNWVNAKGYLIPAYEFLQQKIKSKRLLVALISAISGVLPIPGRTIISAGALDGLAPNDSKRKNYGIINYLSTHHYYLWSPLEATVLIPLSVLGLSYFKFISIIAPLLITLIGITLYYIFFVLKEEDVVIKKIEHKQTQVNPFKNFKWDVVVLVAVVILLGNFMKMYSEVMVETLMSFGSSIFLASVISFVTSFVLGSSSKFAGITTLLVSMVGIQYLPLLFSLGYTGYLVSPTHKCLVITKTYFNLDMSLYNILLIISTALITVGYLSM